tara:strand:+ start:1606 stop:1767 length:162 start_codon:yes stop_codon:yes gene_type:complete
MHLYLYLYPRAVLETWNDISTQFATYELELDRITQLVGGRDKTRRLVRPLVIG